MGGLFDAIFGGDDDVETTTTVTYEVPPELRELQSLIATEIKELKPIAEQTVPDVSRAIQELIDQYITWYREAPEKISGAIERQRGLTEQALQKVKTEGEQARKSVKAIGEDVLQSALRDTIRQLSAAGLISQSAGTQAMSEQFKHYMFDPQINLLGLEMKTLADLLKAGYLQESGILGQQLGFELQRPQYLERLASLKQQKALTPFETRRAILGTLSGVAPTMMQLTPANVVQTGTAPAGINPVFGGLLGTAGSLGLFKLFGII